jgi:hypothetical protein
MRTKIAALALTAGLATTGFALVGPAALAQDATTTASPSAAATEHAAARVTAIKNALAGLVSDGTINQAQADKVATTLSTSDALRGGHGGGGGKGIGRVSSETVAQILGITVDELRAQQQAGQTLAQVADAEGISKADLISKLVAAAKTQLAANVTAGRITQAQADEKAAELQVKITEKVDQIRTGRGDRRTDTPAATATPSVTS